MFQEKTSLSKITPRRRQPNVFRPTEIEFAFRSPFSVTECVSKLEHCITAMQGEFALYRRGRYSARLLDSIRHQVMSQADNAKSIDNAQANSRLQSHIVPLTDNSYSFEIWLDDNLWKIIGKIQSLADSQTLIRGQSQITNQTPKYRMAWWALFGLYVAFIAFILSQSNSHEIAVNAMLGGLMLMILILGPTIVRARQIRKIINRLEDAVAVDITQQEKTK